jgi:hypothetical protein
MVPNALSLDHGWGIGEKTFAHIVDELRKIDAMTIVEFGSGVSSVRLALEFPEAQIVTIESNRDWYDKVMAMRAQHHVETNLTVLHRRLRWQRYGPSVFLSYERGPLPQQIDAVIIDGPPTWTRRGREACLYQTIGHLRVGGRALLDDYGRNREKTIVRNWTRSFPDVFAVNTIRTGHGLCVLDKLRDVSRERPSWRAWPDNVIEAMGVLFTHPLRRE